MKQSEEKKGHRTKLRVDYGHELLIRFDDGSHLMGRAINFSASGFFLERQPGDRGVAHAVGQRGVLVESDLLGETLELPCVVVRVEEKGDAFQFED